MDGSDGDGRRQSGVAALSSGFDHGRCHIRAAVAEQQVLRYCQYCNPRRTYTGNFAIDEEILREEGFTDFEQYAVRPGLSATLMSH